MLLQLLAGLACLICGVFQLAVYREPSIVDSPLRRVGRRLMIAAMFIAAIVALYGVCNRATAHPAYLLLVLVAMSQSLFAFSDLLPHLEKEYRWNSRLNSSP